MVVLGIITVLMSTVLFNYGTFNDKVALSSAGQEMAIAIRQAQTYGLNVKEVTTGSGDFSKSWGIYFTALSPYDYYVFIDKDGDKLYDVGSGSCGSATTECIEQFSIRNGVKISAICAYVSGVLTCPPTGASYLHITFLRPNPDAIVNFTSSPASGITHTSWPTAGIRLLSPKNKVLDVSIEMTGQVYAQ